MSSDVSENKTNNPSHTMDSCALCRKIGFGSAAASRALICMPDDLPAGSCCTEPEIRLDVVQFRKSGPEIHLMVKSPSVQNRGNMEKHEPMAARHLGYDLKIMFGYVKFKPNL